MSTTKKLTCSECKEKVFVEELTYVNKSRKLCKDCLKDNLQKANDYKELIEYICNGFGIKAPTGQQLKSIKKFRELGYEYKEIQYTIFYIFCIERKMVQGTSIELVPYYYEKAMKHLGQCKLAKASATSNLPHEITIKFSPSKPTGKKSTKYIDIESMCLT